jgi:hypothetical protein
MSLLVAGPYSVGLQILPRGIKAGRIIQNADEEKRVYPLVRAFVDLGLNAEVYPFYCPFRVRGDYKSASVGFISGMGPDERLSFSGYEVPVDRVDARIAWPHPKSRGASHILNGVRHASCCPVLGDLQVVNREGSNYQPRTPLIDRSTVSDDIRLLGGDNCVLCCVGTPLRLSGCIAGVLSGSAGGTEGQQAYSETANAEIESALRPQNALSRSVRSLPLGAKIGFSIVFLIGASGIWGVGFVRFLERRSNAAKAFGYQALGVALFGISFLPWW